MGAPLGKERSDQNGILLLCGVDETDCEHIQIDTFKSEYNMLFSFYKTNLICWENLMYYLDLSQSSNLVMLVIKILN